MFCVATGRFILLMVYYGAPLMRCEDGVDVALLAGRVLF